MEPARQTLLSVHVAAARGSFAPLGRLTNGDSSRMLHRADKHLSLREAGVIKVSVFYPNTTGSRFDMPYYLNKHIPMVQQKLGAALKGASVEHGLGGGQPGSPPTYVAMGHLLFDSVEAFQQSWGPHAEAIVGDVPNYTNTQPTIQVSEVKL